MTAILFSFMPARSQDLPFKNPELPTEQRIEDLLSRLTLEEKASQMVHNSPGIDRL